MQLNSVELYHYGSSLSLPKRHIPLGIVGQDASTRYHYAAEENDERVSYPVKILAQNSFTSSLDGWSFIGTFTQWGQLYFLFIQGLESNGGS